MHVLRLLVGFPGGAGGKEPGWRQERQVRSLGGEDPLEEQMATLFSTIAWRIPWTEEPVGLQSAGHKESGVTQRLGHNTNRSLVIVRGRPSSEIGHCVHDKSGAQKI